MPLDEVLPGYRYNKAAARYISNKTGRFVARSSILSLLDGEVLQREMEVGRLTQALMDKQISPSVFIARFRAELRQAHLQFGSLGAGGWDRLTQADYGRMGGILQADYRRLNGFAQDIISGKISEAQALNRAGMYMGNARREYWHTYRGSYPVPKPGYTIIERRVLGVAEHCFPAGTQISVPSGTRAIEQIEVGDVVLTRFGPHRVMETYRHEHVRELVAVEHRGNAVIATENHPFLTNRGWVAALDLRPDDVPVVINNLSQPINRQVGLPYSDNLVTNPCQIGIPRGVAAFLSDLPIKQWLEARMSMPPVPIGLDDKTAYEEINDELGLDKHLRFVFDAKLPKHVSKALFQLRRFVLAHFRVPTEKSFDSLWIVRLLAHPFSRSGQARWVVLPHVFGRSGMNGIPVNTLGKFYTDTIGLILDLRSGHSWQKLHTFVRSSVWKHALNSVVFLVSPLVFSQGVLGTQFRLPITGGTTYWAGIPRQFLLRKFRCPTLLTHIYGALATMSADWTRALGVVLSRRHGSSPILHHNNDARELYHACGPNATSGVMVYNLNVEGAHEYIANGFVVHNCGDCLDLAGRGWQPHGVLPLPGENSQCLSNCRCSLESKTVLIGQI